MFNKVVIQVIPRNSLHTIPRKLIYTS